MKNTLSKAVIVTIFGKPYPDDWFKKYVESVQKLKDYGWTWKCFTEHDFPTVGNFEVVKMNLDKFNGLLGETCQIEVKNSLDGQGIPKKLMSDYYPAMGYIFQKYIKNYDYWAHASWDVVWGRLDHYLSDEFLKDVEIFGNDPDSINGVFSVYKNTPKVNEFFKVYPNWQAIFADCSKQFHIFDEELLPPYCVKARDEGKLKFVTRWWLENDRQKDHDPAPQIDFKGDGTLYNTKTGNEMMLFHFNRIKRWPL